MANAKSRAHYAKNKEKRLKNASERYRIKSELYKERSRKYHRENPGRQKNRRLLSRFGIGLDEYKQKLTAQNNVCAICKMPEMVVDSRTGKTRELTVDHCHKTGKVRGLLCITCNTGLGMLREDLTIIDSLINYIKLYKNNKT